jgi:hypothetical protein
LALEGGSERPGEDNLKADVQRTGESMISQGRHASLMLFRYSRPYTLAGFYYGGGLGYAQEDITWHKRVSPLSMALTDATYVNHTAELKGATANLRVGYRYVGSEYPLLIGAYAGLRHFQSNVTDGPSSSNAQNLTGAPVTPLTADDMAHLQRRYATAPEIGLELGFVL